MWSGKVALSDQHARDSTTEQGFVSVALRRAKIQPVKQDTITYYKTQRPTVGTFKELLGTMGRIGTIKWN